jgi:hemolysin III
MNYQIKEEIANAVTHGIGAALSVAGLSVLVTLAALNGDAWRVVSFSIYGATLAALFLASTLYHSFQKEKTKRFFRMLDHSAIFFLIAGTYTPFTLVTLRGAWGWTIFGIIWSLAIVGVVIQIFFIDRLKWVSLTLYLGMGWMMVFAIKPLIEAMPSGGMFWIAIGGLSYTSGVVFYVWKKLPFNHAIWHLFVLGGAICHFLAMLFYVLPMAKN